MKKLLLLLFLIPNLVMGEEDFTGRYCDISGSSDSGHSISGECWMWADVWGDCSGQTSLGETFTGEVWRWSEMYGDVSGSTYSGESVSGDCYFY
jgi:hypothetical protein